MSKAMGWSFHRIKGIVKMSYAFCRKPYLKRLIPTQVAASQKLKL